MGKEIQNIYKQYFSSFFIKNAIYNKGKKFIVFLDNEYYNLAINWLDIANKISVGFTIFLWFIIGAFTFIIDHSFVGFGLFFGTMLGLFFSEIEKLNFYYLKYEIDKAFTEKGSITFLHSGIIICIIGSNDTCTVARTPFTIIYICYLLFSLRD